MYGNCFRFRRNYTLYNIYKIILAFAVIASSITVVWKFNDECFHIPFPPNSHSKNQCFEYRKKNQRTEQNSEISYKYNITAPNTVGFLENSYPQSQRLSRRLRRILKQSNTTIQGKVSDSTLSSTSDESQSQVLQNNLVVPEIFRNRSKLSNEACSKYIYDEESINFNIDNSIEFLNEMKKLEKLEKGENKIFIKTNPLKRNRWIFYNHHKRKGYNVKIQWCPIYKSASTSWMAIFTKLAGALTDMTTSKIHQGKMTFIDLAKSFRLFYPMAQRSFTKSAVIPTYSMVVVRHPFQRILSAYQDKLERVKGREYFHKMYGKKIVKFFRDGAKSEIAKPEAKIPDWYKAVLVGLSQKSKLSENSVDKSAIIERSLDKRSQAHHLSSNSSIAQHNDKIIKREEIKRMIEHKHDIPTFREFCSYLVTVDPKDMNEHWRPQYLDCSPCHHKFDLFLKVETLEKDKEAVFKLLGYNNSTDDAYLELESTWKQWSNPSKKLKDETFYFSQLNQELLQSLYNIYELDFELFGYSAKKYFNFNID